MNTVQTPTRQDIARKVSALHIISERLPSISEVSEYTEMLAKAECISEFLNEHFHAVYLPEFPRYDFMYHLWQNAVLKINTDILP